jgi:hypothetical protein
LLIAFAPGAMNHGRGKTVKQAGGGQGEFGAIAA